MMLVVSLTMTPVLSFYEFVIFLVFGGNCRKLSSKIGHNVFGKSKKNTNSTRASRRITPLFRTFFALRSNPATAGSSTRLAQPPRMVEEDRDSTRGTRRMTGKTL